MQEKELIIQLRVVKGEPDLPIRSDPARSTISSLLFRIVNT